MGTVFHYDDTFQARLDTDSATVYLFVPSWLDKPLEERPPAAVVN